MFPLQLLALTFISSLSLQDEEDEGERKEVMKEEVTESRYDLIFRRGDLLEVPRTLFTHFGIYLGGGRVAHFIPDILPLLSSDRYRIKQMVTNFRLLLGVIAKCGSVRVDHVDDFAFGAKILVNSTDKVCSCAALQGDAVAQRAERLQGDIAYSLLWWNCEHFVMFCRYGTAVSFQSFQFCKTVRKLLLSSGVAMVMVVLSPCLLLSGAAVSWSMVLLAALPPFLIWMAS
ncbi:lecithin retinol acyltransferase-like [Salarias fasciatus]|uniref:Lecithin retinol acyltransferase-like n=1 Tax=Salarias fasciatus TaxID=181472 RepID=A0A672FUD3_SALFA|nr:lecithin retinol acyltransferase-like [Salarias fasciatus]